MPIDTRGYTTVSERATEAMITKVTSWELDHLYGRCGSTTSARRMMLARQLRTIRKGGMHGLAKAFIKSLHWVGTYPNTLPSV